MQRGDVDAGFKQLRHHRINLTLGQHKIAHYQRAIGYRLEAEPAAECQRRLDGHAVDGHLKVAARNAVAVDIALHGRGLAERSIHLCPIDLVCVGLTGERNHDAEGSK